MDDSLQLCNYATITLCNFGLPWDFQPQVFSFVLSFDFGSCFTKLPGFISVPVFELLTLFAPGVCILAITRGGINVDPHIE